MRRAKFSFNSGNRVDGVFAMNPLSRACGLWAVLQKVLRNSGLIYWHCENWKKFCTLNLGSRGSILRDRRNTFTHVSLFSLRFLVAGAALVTCRRCWFDESLAGLRARVAVSRVSEAVARVAFCDCGGNFACCDRRQSTVHEKFLGNSGFLVAKCENWRKSRTNVHFVYVYNLEKVSRETALFT